MTKKIAALNDISGFGKCSLSAALPIISALGIQACPLPTAVLSNQTCYSTYFMKDLTEETKSIIDKWSEFKASFDGIYTGFISTEKQAETVLEFIDEFKSENTVFLSDPVMGDGGIIYPSFTTGLCEKIRLITSKADIVTPNITELGILAGMSADYVFKMPKDEKYLKNISKLAETLLKGKTKTIVVTGIAYKANEDKEDMFYNAVVTPKGTKFVKSKVLSGSFSGTGDIFASIVCACAVRGMETEKAVEIAVDFIYKAVEDTVKDNTDINDGVNFEKFLSILTDIKL